MKVAAENSRPGTNAWWTVEHAREQAIEGYSTQASVPPGGRLELCVSTRPVARYEVTVYRLGWYGGRGGREIARGAPNIGRSRRAPDPDAITGLVAAGWPVTDIVELPPDAASGHWVAHLTLVSGPHAGHTYLVPFVVTPAPDDRPTVLVQIGVNTAQAYNHWGGKCLYPSNSTDNEPAVKVSFDRPIPPWREANLNSKAPFHYDLALARWLEREGYDVGYQTNVDTHRAPWSLVGPRLVVSSGHDEYWSTTIRDAFDDARDRGTNLAFLGANAAYWHIRYEDDERTVVCHKAFAADPEPDGAAKTCRFRHLEPPREEHELLGVRYERGLTDPAKLFDYALDPASLDDAWMAGTGFAEDPSPVRGVVGYEWEGRWPDHDPPSLVRFFHRDDPLGPADCVRWTAPSGARILSAGSLGLVLALDEFPRGAPPDPRVQRFLKNALDQLAVR